MSLQVLDLAECKRLLGSVPVGRVGVTFDALPAILPVNFVVHDGAVVFRTVPGTKLDAATLGAVVAFEVDGFDADGSGWSVLVRGVAHELAGSELTEAKQLPLQSWAFGDDAGRFVTIATTIVTGRRAHAPSGTTR